MLMNELKSFRELCQEHGIAVTHQRQVLYEVMKTMHGHPSPEKVYAGVKKKVPAISLATVYKNIHLFVESDVFELSSLNYEPNSFGNPTQDPRYKERPTTSESATVEPYDHRELDGDYYTQPATCFV